MMSEIDLKNTEKFSPKADSINGLPSSNSYGFRFAFNLLGAKMRSSGFLGRGALGGWLPALLGVSLLTNCASVVAHPIDTFSGAAEVICASGSRTCAGVARSEGAIGRHTGVLISKGEGGEVKVGLKSGRNGVLRIEGKGSSNFTVTLSWDGDANPGQLSGSGLNCLDLTKQGASAFILLGGNGSAECADGDGFGPECPRFTIQSRIYDALDPTGQRFSASVIHREVGDKSDIVIPFSNFIMRGPRGVGRLECVGAITIAMSFSGYGAVELRTGAFFTNGSEGLTPLPATPTVEPSVAVDEVRAVAEQSAAAESAGSPAGDPIEASRPPVAESADSKDLEPSSRSPEQLPVPQNPERVEPLLPAIEQQPNRPAQPPAPEPPAEEAVYGAVVAE